MSRSIILALSFFSWFALLSVPSPAAAQAKYIVQPIAEMKVKQLPKGELFWRVESFPTLDKAKAAAPPVIAGTRQCRSAMTDCRR